MKSKRIWKFKKESFSLIDELADEENALFQLFLSSHLFKA